MHECVHHVLIIFVQHTETVYRVIFAPSPLFKNILFPLHLSIILPQPVDAGTYITVTLLLVITVILYLDFMQVHFQPMEGGCPFTN